MYFERVIKVARIYLENWTMRKSSERREGHLPDRLILSLRNNLLILRAHFSISRLISICCVDIWDEEIRSNRGGACRLNSWFIEARARQPDEIVVPWKRCSREPWNNPTASVAWDRIDFARERLGLAITRFRVRVS